MTKSQQHEIVQWKKSLAEARAADDDSEVARVLNNLGRHNALYISVPGTTDVKLIRLHISWRPLLIISVCSGILYREMGELETALECHDEEAEISRRRKVDAGTHQGGWYAMPCHATTPITV